MGTTIRPNDINASTASKLQTLDANLERFRSDASEYYDDAKDKADVEQYYARLNRNEQDGKALFQALTRLLTETHKKQVPYNHEDKNRESGFYLKTSVDLHDDEFLRSIYSGKEAEPHKVIEEDEAMVAVAGGTSSSGHEVNIEHVVPQSWFDKAEPMRGDMHHLFYCEIPCNSFRGNKIYVDFADYNPDEFRTDTVRGECGKGVGGEFEPEYAKGVVARAMLYFILRYPDKIEKEYVKRQDVNVLLKWHKDFPPNLKYEKHRNQAIYAIQGNRNPFIDLPELADRIDFSVYKPSQQ